MSASIQRLPVTIPPGVWTEVLSGFSSVTVQVGSPGQVWPLHDREIDFIFSATAPTGAETDRFQVLLDDKHLNRWSDPVTLGTKIVSGKLYAKPARPGLYGLVRVVSWDVTAAALVGVSGSTVQSDHLVWVDGRVFINPTSAALTIPTPATRATMATAGFRDVTETSRRYDLTTAISVTATEAEHGIFARSNAGDISIEFPTGMPVMSQRVAARDGTGEVVVRIGDGTTETIDGQPFISLENDAYVYLIKETATAWRTVEENVGAQVYNPTTANTSMRAGSFYLVADGHNLILPPASPGDFVRLMPEDGLLWSAWTGQFTTPGTITINNGVLSSVDRKEITLVMNRTGTSWLVGD